MARREDSRLLQGRGRYLSDLEPAGVAHAVFLRADRPHARILGIDAAAALRQPGVLAVLTAAELAADGIPDIPIGLTMPGTADAARRVLARDEVRFVGEPVALVVACSACDAVDAVEHIQVSYEDLPEVTSIEAALQDGAPSVWPEAPDNIGFDWSGGDAARVADAFRGAVHVTRQQIRVSRVVVNALEVRSALGDVDGDGRLTLTIGHQQPYALRDVLARAIFRVEPSCIRIRVPDIGGSFGLKTGVHSEEVAVLWAARRLRRPVKWVSTRSEAFLGDDHARDVVIDAALALDGDGTFLGFETRFDVNVGCYLSGRSAATVNNIGGAAGVYRIPAIGARVRGVLTHTSPTGPYRGAGRPEATYALERIIDIAARELGRDPFALRRQNLIPAAAMPFRTALTFTYDCGDFAANMDEAARLADIAGFPARRAEAARRGRLRGIGVANLIEAAAGPYGRPSRDTASLNVMPDGAVVLTSGAISTGQGHETVFSRLVADRLTIPHDQVQYRSGDTDALPAGRGNGGSGASGVSAAAVTGAADAMIERGRALAADELEVAAADLVLEDGAFVVAGTDLRRSWAQLAAAAGSEDGLCSVGDFQPESVTFPNGCHVCEVEIDPQTGEADVAGYVAVEDLGHVLDPVLVDGQLHGGIMQGIGQVLLETACYDPVTGQLVTGSFTDYAMPRATETPSFLLETQAVLTAVNPLGSKGVGEAGTVGALSAVMNAICDALAPLGIAHVDMPARAEVLWRAIAAARFPASFRLDSREVYCSPSDSKTY